MREVREQGRKAEIQEAQVKRARGSCEEVRSWVLKDVTCLASSYLLLSWLVSVRMMREDQRQRQSGVFCHNPGEREYCAFN